MSPCPSTEWVRREKAPPYRRNRSHASVPLKFWDEAFSTAVYLINRLPSKVIGGDTPFSRLLNSHLDYTSLRTFGCACWPNLRPYNDKKLQFRSKRCVFLGYNNLHKGFKCLDPSVGRVYISRNVIFDVKVFPFATLHPNAGARLRSEISLLPDPLLNPSTRIGDVSVTDHNVHSPVPTNAASSSIHVVQDTGRNSVQNGANSEENRGHFMCPPVGDSANSQVDLPGVDTGRRSGSSSGLVESQAPSLSRSASSPSSVDLTNSTGSSAAMSGASPLADGGSSPHPDLRMGGQASEDLSAISSAAGAPAVSPVPS